MRARRRDDQAGQDARDTAAAGVRDRAAHRRATNAPRVHAVLLPPEDLLFGWEIRDFRREVLSRGRGRFRMASDAAAAGEQALVTLLQPEAGEARPWRV